MTSRLRTGLGAFVASAALVASYGACSGAPPSDLLGTPPAGSGADSGSSSGGHDAAAEAGPTDKGVNCPGSGTCTVPSQVCCKSGTSTACIAAGGCPSPSISIPCDDTADCVSAGHANTVCCITNTAQNTPADITCRPLGECTAQNSRTLMCDPAVSGTCPSGQSCVMSMVTLPGFYICR